jgi:hypothetical protein
VRDGWPRRITDHPTRYGPDRSKHDRSRDCTQGRVSHALLSTHACWSERQRHGRNSKDFFHATLPSNELVV